MKRFFTLFAVTSVAMLMVGCFNSYEKKAREWICDQVDHFACPDISRHALYYLDESIGWGYTLFEKVDLKDGSIDIINSLTCDDGTVLKFSALSDYGLPEDKGYGGSKKFLISVEDENLPKDQQEVAVIYDTKGGPHKKICQGSHVLTHGFSLVTCAHATKSSISAVYVYDVKGNKLEPKIYDGTIAGQSVVVELVEKDGYISGSYYYTKYGPGKHRLIITGEVDEDRDITLRGYNRDSWGSLFETEVWKGTLKDGVVDAHAEIQHTKRTYHFTLIERK